MSKKSLTQESIVAKLVDSFNDRSYDYAQKTALQLAIEDFRDIEEKEFGQNHSNEYRDKFAKVRDLAFPIVQQLVDLKMLDVFCPHAIQQIDAAGCIGETVKDLAKNGNIMLNITYYPRY